ncbi:MAG: hypothetical protein ACOYLE_02245 [Bacteroidales bacterium]
MKKTIISEFFTIKLKTKPIFLASLFVSIFLFACVKEGDFEFDKLASNQFNPSIAAPFVSSRLTLKDIIKDTSGIIQVNSSDNSLKLVYITKKLVSVMAKALFKIPNQGQIDNPSINITAPTGDSSYTSFVKHYSFKLPATPPGQRIDSVFIKTATLKIHLNTYINHKGKLKLTIPNIKYPNGQSFHFEIQTNYDGTQPLPYNVPIPPIDLSGCKIIFNQTPLPNEIEFDYEQWVYKNPVFPYSNPYSMEFNDSITNITYDKLFGYIGQQEFPLTDTLNLDIFNNQLAGQFEFDNITVGITTINSYGLPIEAKVNSFQAQNGSTIYPITDFPSTNPFNIAYPTIVGDTTVTNINNQPSNDLANAINHSPKTIIYNVTGKANPTNNTAIPNFVIDTSNFSVSVNIDLPLQGKVGGFVLQDTLDFDLKNIKDLEEITFRINTWNAFPLSAKVQVYFTNTSYGILDSLVTNGQEIISAGVINSLSHMVTAPTFRFNDFTMIKSRLLKIENAKKILVRASLSSPNYPTQTVKISNNDYLDVKLGMKVKINASTK